MLPVAELLAPLVLYMYFQKALQVVRSQKTRSVSHLGSNKWWLCESLVHRALKPPPYHTCVQYSVMVRTINSQYIEVAMKATIYVARD